MAVSPTIKKSIYNIVSHTHHRHLTCAIYLSHRLIIMAKLVNFKNNDNEFHQSLYQSPDYSYASLCSMFNEI